jgi:sporulation protein YlmC with PRC-barrel domain
MDVYSEDGEQVGTISELYFDEGSGRIVGLEISAGMVGDLAEGPRFLPVDQIDRVGDQIVYIKPGSAESLGPVPGGSTGAKGAMEEAKARVSEATQGVGQQVSNVADQVRDGMASGGQGAQGGPDAKPGSELVGRRSGAEVADADGRILVANGQRISEEHVARARETGQLEELRAAADAGTAAERERVMGGTVEQITDTAGSVWDRFMRTISEMRDATGQRMSEEQTKARLASINDAVGRPVTKVILDRNDEVILDLGDIITHEAVQRAYEAGILDSLLDSVYKGEVAFERDEMKASVAATSTVEKASGGAAVVSELEETVSSAESARQEASEQQRREADEARDRREEERAERARQRDEAARRAEAGEPEPVAAGTPEPGGGVGGTSPVGISAAEAESRTAYADASSADAAGTSTLEVATSAEAIGTPGEPSERATGFTGTGEPAERATDPTAVGETLLTSAEHVPTDETYAEPVEPFEPAQMLEPTDPYEADEAFVDVDETEESTAGSGRPTLPPS